jgi:hypothetical protein
MRQLAAKVEAERIEQERLKQIEEEERLAEAEKLA